MPLSDTLKSIAKALRRIHCFTTVSKAVSCLSLFFLALSALNMANPLTEMTCTILGWFAVIIVIIYIIKDLRISSNHLNIHSLAMDVEHVHPELMDSFICAVELEAKTEPLRPMEAGLLADVHRRVQSTFILKDTFSERLRLTKPLVWGLAAVIFTVGAIHTPAARKWLHANRNAFTFAKATEDEYPRHSDVQIAVSANRWEQDIWIDIMDGDGNRQRYPMHHSEEDDTSSFVFYDVQNAVRYRVGSPSLRSKWFSFNIFDPPEITSLTITVTPPAYTGKPVATYTELQDFAVIEGSVIAIDVKSSVEATQAIVTKSEKQPLDIHSFILKETDDLRIVLTDNDGHQKMTPWFRVTVEPDLQPVLEQRQPTGDIKIHSFDSVRLDASASDDFGLNTFGLQFTINGVQRQVVLFNEHKDGTPWQTTWDHNALWDIPAMKLKDGDMLSCVFFVEDNREPAHQTVRGEVFFITVEPDEDEIEADGADSGDQKRTSVADLIVEAKRLLRLTWDTLSLQPQDRARQTDELQRGLPDLQLEIARRENKLKEELRKTITDANKPETDGETPSAVEETDDDDPSKFTQVTLPEPFNTLFAAAIKAEDAAARLAKDTLLEESAIPQERALTHLVKIENELLRNAMKSKKSKEGKEGKGEQKSQEKQEKNEEKSENSQNQQQTDTAKQLEEAAELLRRQIAKQESINASATAQDAVASGLADKQQELGHDTEDLEKTLRPIKEAAMAREAIARAAAEMAHGAEALRKQDLRTGAIHGGRAHSAQMEALRVIEDAIQAAAANQLRRLGEQARDLSKRQMDAAEQSGEFKNQQEPVSQQDTKQARQQQQNLKEQAEQLRRAMQATAEQLDQMYPEVAKELRDSVRNMDERKILAAQQRALNALLYKRFDRAEKEQTDASNLLAALAMELDATAGKMPNMTAQELREALQKLQQQARQTAQTMEGEGQQASDKMEQLRQQAQQNLQKLGEKLKDNRLNELSDNMSLPFNGESPSEAGQFILRNLQQATQILAEHLQRLTMEKKRELSRSQLAPPLKYRRLVEDYFKQMSR